jgi:hypothetical protein
MVYSTVVSPKRRRSRSHIGTPKIIAITAPSKMSAPLPHVIFLCIVSGLACLLAWPVLVSMFSDVTTYSGKVGPGTWGSINQELRTAVAQGASHAKITLASVHDQVYRENVQIPPGLVSVWLLGCGGRRRPHLETRGIKIERPDELVSFVMRGLRLEDPADCSGSPHEGQLFQSPPSHLEKLVIDDMRVVVHCAPRNGTAWLEASVGNTLQYSDTRLYGINGNAVRLTVRDE